MNVIRRTRDGIEVLTWLQALLLLAHESRKSIDEASAALRSGEACRTFFSLFTMETDMTAQAICDQIDALFGDTSRPQAETLADMRKIADRAGEFAALGDEDEDDLIGDTDDLIEAGDIEAVRAAHEFALKRLDSMDPRSAQYGQRVESTANDLLKLLSESDDFSLMVFVDHVEERLQIAA